MNMKADERQVGGAHYKAANPAQEHWNLVVAYGWDYFTAQIIKYLMRWPKKNGLQDLEKARHFLDKLIEVEKAKAAPGHTDLMVSPEAINECVCPCHRGEDILHVVPCCARYRVIDGEPSGMGYVDQD